MDKTVGRIKTAFLTEVLRRGFVSKTPSLVLRSLPLESAEQSVVQVIVSKKTAKGAVERNLLKRRGRELLCEKARHLPSPYALLLIFQKGSAEKSYKELREEFSGLDVSRPVKTENRNH